MKPFISKRDSFSCQLLIDEGLFFRRLLWHQHFYPDSSINLMIVAFPFVAVIEHDSKPFAERLSGEKLPCEDSRLAQIRHLTKGLDSSKMRFQDYSNHAHRVIEELGSSMRTHNGFSAPLLNYLQPDVGITYHRGMPVYATFSAAHLFTKDSPSILGDNDGQFTKEISYNAGVSAALQYSLADHFFQDKTYFTVKEYRTFSNDRRFSKLCSSISDCVADAVGVFFLLSELMMQLCAVESLRQAGFLEMSVWIKFQTIALYQLSMSVGILSGYLRKSASLRRTLEFVHDLDGIITRESKRAMKRIRPLRNSLIHYDFSEKIYPELNEKDGPWSLLEDAIFQTTGYSLSEYSEFLITVGEEYRQGLACLLNFPKYNPAISV